MLEDYKARRSCNQMLKEIHAKEIIRLERYKKLPSVSKYIKTLADMIRDEEEIIKSIDAALDRMEDPLYKKLLRLKFIENIDQQEISEQENYSYTYISRLINKAIDEFQGVEE